MLSTPFLVVALVPVFFLYTTIYRVRFHPLSKVPGPALARVTKLWLVWHVRKGKNTTFFPALHKRYGPIVRIAPDQVIACSEDAIKAAYSAGTAFTKGSWYRVAAAPDKARRGDDHLDLLTEDNKDKYRKQRRAIGPAYSIAGLEKHEALLDAYIDKYMARIKSLDGSPVDLAEWTHIYALDAISTFTLSDSLDYTGQGHDGGNLAASDTAWGCFTVVGLFPGLVTLMHSIPKVGMLLMAPSCLLLGISLPKLWPIFAFAAPGIMARLRAFDSTKNVTLFGDRPGLVVSQAQKVAAKESSDDNEKGENDHLATLMELHHDKEARFRPSWVMGIAMTNFGAGHDTIMHTLAACIYHTYASPSLLARLRKEMTDHGITAESGYTDLVTHVPLYLAILKESLRIWPAVGFWLPRTVPPTGATICSTYLPPGTTVGVSPWAVGHDASLFPSPDTFDPDRWLTPPTLTNPEAIAARRQQIHRLESHWLGFGGQSRSCPGQHLGRFFVVKVLARLVAGFDAEFSGQLEFRGWFATAPTGVGVRWMERKGGAC